MRGTALVGLAIVLASAGAWAEDERGGAFDLVLEGGALGGARGAPSSFTPIAQADVLGRARVAKHLALTGGLSALPVPQVFALGAIGRLEWLPLDAEPLMFSAFVGSRLLVVQPICVVTTTSTCATDLGEGGGVLGEIGVAFRTARLSGYRAGVSLSAVAGVVAPYDDVQSLRALYVGGIAGLAVTF
jgi:hypothetical protein